MFTVKEKQEVAHESGEPCEVEDCEECCEHDDTEDYSCLGCGKDMTETMAARADHFKD